MEQATKAPAALALAPVAAAQRIEALDVVRGFALIGVLFMNIEFFNRNSRGVEEGMPVGLTGVDFAASWFVAYFVQGKFWTIFSLLFGMGFAVMFSRAERAESDFMGAYLRRIAALAVFGASHYLFVWDGDILFSYAMGAGALLVLLYGKWKYILLAMVALSGLALIPDLRRAWGIVAALLSLGLLSVYLRSDRRVTIRGRSLPLFSFLMVLLGSMALIAAVVLWSLPLGSKAPRAMITITSIGMLVAAFLAAKYRDPIELRGRRLGTAIYVFAALIMTSIGAVQYFTPREPVTAAGPAAKSDAANEAQEAAAERAQRLFQQQQEDHNEVRILSQGTYLEAVEMRALKFPNKVANDAGFSTLLVALFLLGVWFIRSGVMENARAHLALFRKLALVGLPVGVGLGLLGSMIATTKTPGDDHDGFLIARGLAVLGNLPACLGYVGAVVLMLYSNSPLARIRILAPFGRMALTNYLMQSVICTSIFYGYGLGHWGLGRAWQLVFATVLLALQIAFSHWWLSRYRFGPMEWLWRGFTYRRTPALRL
jgi:uncharacterized membrane protein YeiB